MRVDGAIRTLNGGMSTLDDRQHKGQYNRVVDNFYTDPIEGLVRRPASEWTQGRDTHLYKPETDAMIPIVFGDTMYWLMVQPNEGAGGSHRLVLYTSDYSSSISIDHPNPSEYFNTLTGNSALGLAQTGKVLYLTNKNTVARNTNQQDSQIANSMIVVKQAPAIFSKLKVTWKTSADETKEIEIEVVNATDWEQTDTGTNSVAMLLASAMNGVGGGIGSDQIFVRGSTVSYERSDGDYADISVEDSANGNVLASINAETQDLSNLPKYATPNATVTIRPNKNTEKGVFYMRSIPYIEETSSSATVSPLPEHKSYEQKKAEGILNPAYVVTPGYRSKWDADRYGFIDPAIYNNELTMGSVAPANWQGWKIMQTSTDFAWSGHTPHVTIILDQGGRPAANQISHIMLVEQITGKVLVSASARNTAISSTGGTWQCNIGSDQNMVPGIAYDIYTSYQEEVFGKLPEVSWQEWSHPTEPKYWNPNTLPHVLAQRGDGTFVTGPAGSTNVEGDTGFRERGAGDNNSNPFPEFLNNPIRDVSLFQERLVILSKDTVSMSITNKPGYFFRESATQITSADPIGIKSTSEEAYDLRHMLQHNRDTLLFSRHAQFKISGSSAITPSNASMMQSSAYPTQIRTKPVSVGTDVFFPINFDKNTSGIMRYTVDTNADTQDIAQAMSAHVHTMIEGDIEIIAGNANHSILYVKGSKANELYVMSYRFGGRNHNIAWTRWIYPEEMVIINLYASTSTLFIMCHDREETDRVFCLTSDLYRSPSAYPDIGIQEKLVMLDMLRHADNVQTRIPIPYNYPISNFGFKLVQGGNCPDPYAEITGWSVDEDEIVLPENMLGGRVWFGFTYVSVFEPPQRWIRDDSGVPQYDAKLRITDYGLHSIGEGINFYITGTERQWPVQQIGAPEEEGTQFNRISYKQPATKHSNPRVEVVGNHQTKLLHMEWRGTHIKRGRRL